MHVGFRNDSLKPARQNCEDVGYLLLFSNRYKWSGIYKLRWNARKEHSISKLSSRGGSGNPAWKICYLIGVFQTYQLSEKVPKIQCFQIIWYAARSIFRLRYLPCICFRCAFIEIMIYSKQFSFNAFLTDLSSLRTKKICILLERCWFVLICVPSLPVANLLVIGEYSYVSYSSWNSSWDAVI